MKKKRFISIFIQGVFTVSILILLSCESTQVKLDPPTGDCEYSFLNEPISFCGFDLDKVPYCIDCPDEEGKLGTYNILIDQPDDAYAESVPLRPTVLAVHGYAPNSADPKDPYAGLFLPSMRNNFCQYGYSVATLEYRQDIKGFSNPVCDISTVEVIKTHYRAIQDLRKAINVLYQNPVEYGIDIDNLFLLGNSQGAMTILNGMLATDEIEWLETFPVEYQNIKEDLGPWEPRRPIKGIIAIAGPLYSLDLLDSGDDIPLFLGHGVCDSTVPYKTGTYFGCNTDITVHGAYEIACRANQLNKPYSLHSVNGLGHDWTDEKNNEIVIRIRKWIKDQIVCDTPHSEEFTTEANEMQCVSTSTSVQDCQ
ncbi:alpha/beta hydrolase family protein [Maribacter halichondriae]|uniref:alpha/beta hydrolase family protein n=1 Tax=Maribacter halichondriae TaxID=2980554 RepID=UPI002358B10F|nr:hypothetical protein [Maribacter sp. Hal144]